MKILQINNSNFIEGGTERYYLGLSSLLEDNDHQIAFFSSNNPRNTESLWNKYFVDYLSTREFNNRNVFKIISRVIYSFESKKKINLLLDSFHPGYAVYFRF